MKKILLLVVFLLISGSAMSEILKLKNGDVIEGKFLGSTNDSVMFSTKKDGTTVFKISEIDTIDGKQVYVPEPAPKGLTRIYYLSGAVQSESNQNNGTFITYYEDGAVQSETTTNEDGLISSKGYDKEGKVIHDSTVKLDREKQSLSATTQASYGDILNLKSEVIYDKAGHISTKVFDESDTLIYSKEGNSPAVYPSVDIDIKTDRELAESHLRALSTASEIYGIKNSGNYATDFESLNNIQSDKHKLQDYCGNTISNYEYECELSSNSYTFRAIPTTQDNSSQTTMTITTGGILTPKQ